MGAKYVPLTVVVIEEGAFVKDMDGALGRVQAGLVAYAREHGPSAVKAKATLGVKITLQVEAVKGDDASFSIKTEIAAKVPIRPAFATLAIADDEEGGGLYVRASGSSRTHPRQGKLTTDAGQVIDTDTGEVVSETAEVCECGHHADKHKRTGPMGTPEPCKVKGCKCEQFFVPEPAEA